MDKFAERLRESLRVNRISQSELARRINKSQNIVNAYCSGKSSPPMSVFVLICKVLDESADYFLGLGD